MSVRGAGGQERAPLLKVVLLGDGGAGKSCLMQRFVADRFDEHNFHTIGVEFLNKDMFYKGDKYTLQIWDTAGQERFKSLRTPFYRGTDICLLTYSVDDRTSFNNLASWLQEFRQHADLQQDNDSFPFIVIGNKADLPSSSREVSTEQVSDWCSQHRVSSHVETSAKTAANVQEAFCLGVERWLSLERRAERDLRTEPGTVTLDHHTQSKSSCCSRS